MDNSFKNNKNSLNIQYDENQVLTENKYQSMLLKNQRQDIKRGYTTTGPHRDIIQLFFNYNNKFCPRDAKDQIKYFKKKVELKNIKKNDLIFWKGHVAVVISETLDQAKNPAELVNLSYKVLKAVTKGNDQTTPKTQFYLINVRS